MAFAIFGSECAPGILDTRPAVGPGTATTYTAPDNLVHVFALDRVPISRRRLLCHWRRQADGCLACSWEPDIVLTPQR
jgi:hypothetical protein